MSVQETFNQFGGGRAMLMIGGQAIDAGGEHLLVMFKAKAKNRANRVSIKLEASDTYTVEFWYERSYAHTTRSIHSNVYADQLRELFERETGLYLSLGTMAVRS
jgi:hypothetical protein